MSDNIEEKVKKLIVEKLNVDPEKVTPTAKFAEDLGADSLDTVELVMELEEEFSIEVPDEAAEKILTVKDAIDGAKDIIVIFDTSLCKSAFELEGKNKDKSVLKVVMEAYAENAGDLDTLPVKIYYPNT